MKLFGGKFIKTGVARQIYGAKESRDAIVISINTSTRSTIVRIQGTDEDIYAPWPEGIFQAPPWLRVGSCVRVHHPKGNATKIQMEGPGSMIPTPVGAGSVLPTQPATANVVIVGGAVTVDTGMDLDIASGAYRISNASYSLTAGSVTLSAAPSSPNFRIDMLSVGVDDVIDVTAGTPHATAPVAPTLAADHALIKYIMVPYGTTQLDQALHVGKTAAPALFALEFAMSDVEMLWADTTSTGTISLTDQYEKPIPGNYGFTVEVSRGNGSIEHDSDGSSTTSISWTETSVSSDTFVYTRAGNDHDAGTPDSSPILKAYLTDNSDLYAEVWIELFDSLADYMP